jgi:hypothetical protein
MSNPQPVSKRNWQVAWAAMLIVAGIGAIATSFVWPGKASRLSGWSNEQAQLYQAASTKLHSLLHEIAKAPADRKQGVQDQLKSSQAEYDALRSELESAMSRPRHLSWILRTFGALLVVGGGIILYRLPTTEQLTIDDGFAAETFHLSRK